MGYRTLRVSPTVKCVGLIQPSFRTFSSNMIRYNHEQLGKNTVNDTATLPPKEQVTTAVTPQSRIGQFIQKSKDLIRFYKDGLKLLWSNNKEAKALLLKVQNEGYVLNRSEFQLINQSKKDMVKLIPFGFVFLILPESVKNRSLVYLFLM
jgi:hypothetical protein